VESDDPTTPNLILTLSMDVQVELGFETPSLRFNEARVGQEARQAVKLVGTALAEASFGAVSSDVEGLTAKVVTRDDPAGPVKELEVLLKASKTGALHGTVRVTTTLAHMPSITLPVYAQIKGDVTVEPRVASFAPEAPDKTLLLTVRSARPGLKITGVTDEKGLVEGKARAQKDGSWQIELALSAKAKPTRDLFSTSLKLATTYPEEPVVEVMVTRGGAGQRNFSRDPLRRAPPIALPVQPGAQPAVAPTAPSAPTTPHP